MLNLLVYDSQIKIAKLVRARQGNSGNYLSLTLTYIVSITLTITLSVTVTIVTSIVTVTLNPTLT